MWGVMLDVLHSLETPTLLYLHEEAPDTTRSNCSHCYYSISLNLAVAVIISFHVHRHHPLQPGPRITEKWKPGKQEPPVLGTFTLMTSLGGLDVTLMTACNPNVNIADVHVGSVRLWRGRCFLLGQPSLCFSSSVSYLKNFFPSFFSLFVRR